MSTGECVLAAEHHHVLTGRPHNGLMPRANRPPRPVQVPLQRLAHVRNESGPDGEWVVHTVPASRADKTYRCPGCDQTIPPGVAHLVTWPAGEYGSVTERRHWHAPCWAARGRRRPGMSR